MSHVHLQYESCVDSKHTVPADRNSFTLAPAYMFSDLCAFRWQRRLSEKISVAVRYVTLASHNSHSVTVFRVKIYLATVSANRYQPPTELIEYPEQSVTNFNYARRQRWRLTSVETDDLRRLYRPSRGIDARSGYDA